MPGPGKLTLFLARRSEQCPVCRCARRDQRGPVFWLVKTFEHLCPFCRAYEKVHHKKSHEPVPDLHTRQPLPLWRRE